MCVCVCGGVSYHGWDGDTYFFDIVKKSCKEIQLHHIYPNTYKCQ